MDTLPINSGLTELLDQACQEAAQRGVKRFGPEYYLESLLTRQSGLPVWILHHQGIALDDLRIELLQHQKRKAAKPVAARPNAAAERVLKRARAISDQLGHDWTGLTHLLLALIQDTESYPGQLLQRYGVHFDPVRDHLLQRMREDSRPFPRESSAPREVSLSPLLTDILRETPDMARLWRREQCEPEHLLAALLHRGQGRAIQILRELGVDLVDLSLALEQRVEMGEHLIGQQIGPSPVFEDVMAQSRRMAQSLQRPEVDTEHLLLALLQIDSMARTLLTEFRLDEAGVRKHLSKTD